MSEDNDDIPMFLQTHMDGKNTFKKKKICMHTLPKMDF